jgi:hypothetical protein
MPIVDIKGVGRSKFPDDMDANNIREFLRNKYTQQVVAGQSDSDLLQNASKYGAPTGSSLEVVDPTLSEKVSSFVGDSLYDSGVISSKTGARDVGKNLAFLGEVATPLGGFVGADDFADAIDKGDAFGVTLGALSTLPVVGKGAKKLGAKYQELKTPDVDNFLLDPAANIGTPGGFDKITSEVPIVNPEDLVGRTVVPTLADMTGAGRGFEGIDSSKIMPIELQGGPGFPMLDSYKNNNIVWAVNDKGGQTKLQKGDIIAVSAMNPKAHRSNATVTQSFLSTLDSYVVDGRMSKKNVKQLNKMIKANVDFKDFPGLDNQDVYHKWAENLTFKKRSKFTKLLGNSKSQDLGTPNFQKILDETIDPDFAGYNQGDNMLLIEVDKTPDARIELGTGGTKKHRSYKYGVTGKVVGKFARPVSSKTLFPDFYEDRRKSGAKEKKDYRSFQLKLPSQTITPEIAASIPSKPFDFIKSPRQAKLAQNFINDNWVDSRSTKKAGGISVSDFSQALKRSDSSATLTLYNTKDLNKEIRTGKTSIHQLKDSEIFFAIKNDYNYNDIYEDLDLVEAGLSTNERAVVGVVNNEKGAKGVAGPAVMLKAIEEGATVLDAFSVKSKKFPNGFLPSLYGEYGFKEVAAIPFESKYYSDIELKDLERVWEKGGWNKSEGYPEVSIMKWSGDDNARKTAKQDWLNAIESGDESGIIGQGKEESIGAASQAFFEPGSTTGGQVRGAGNAGNDTRGLRDSNRAPNNRGFRGVVNEVNNLSVAERLNLGLPTN